MKKLLFLVLCALLAAGSAEARTLYVNASRPNNNGNGLKPATAKKTIQAAINLAKNGDTILVYPGTYHPIQTNDKRIAIKSVKGAAKTKIVKSAKFEREVVLAQLGMQLGLQYDKAAATGRKTALCGLLLDGQNRNLGSGASIYGVSCGTVKSCIIQHLGDKSLETDVVAVRNATLTGCTIKANYGHVCHGSDCSNLNRCKIVDNIVYSTNCYWRTAIDGGAFSNCLIAGNMAGRAMICAADLVNCTIVKNRVVSEDEAFSDWSNYYNCILRNNYRGKGSAIHNVDSRNGYTNTFKDNRNPKFVNEAGGNYMLAKGSPCIDQGRVTDDIKPTLGSLDLAGRKRIRGKAIDMGCYEY
jgi:hypothetical protein